MTRRITELLQNAKAVTISVMALAITLLVLLMCYHYVTANSNDNDQADTPPISESDIPGLCGWAGEEKASQAFEELKGQFVPFVIWDTQQKAEAVSQDKRSVLWDASLKVLGKHIPNIQQQIGDCVSFGAANAVMYLQCVQAATGKDPIKYRPVFQPYIYGTSRVLVGSNQLGCNSDGSVGAWAAAAVKKYGVLFSDEPNVPAYSGSVAKQWGCRKAAFDRFIDIADDYPVQSIAQVRTWQQVRDALVNGYPVTVASGQGFQMRGVVRDGKLFGVPSGRWAHQMCFIGYDPEPKPCFYCLNSWGPNAHGKCPDDAPPGGFWVDSATVQRMVQAGDSFAFSAFKGFPANNEWNLDILLQKGIKNAAPLDGDADRITRHTRSTDYALAP